jgi:hypothetical protein
VAKGFRSWTVLEHGPMEKLSGRVWTVSGSMPNGRTQRRMVIVKLSGERLLFHNAIALQASAMAELEGWGKPAYLLVPNSFHRQDAWIWKQRYPELSVLCPKGCTQKVAEEVAVDGSYDQALGDSAVQLFHWRGTREREGGILVRESDRASLILNDVVLNLPRQGGVMGMLLAPTGVPSVPRISRWMLLKDQRSFQQHLLELADTQGLCRVLVAHGATIEVEAREALRTAAQRLS